MRKIMSAGAVFVTAALAMTATAAPVVPPGAAERPHVVKAPFGAERSDPWYWLRDDSRKNPEMLGWLAGENAYADALLAPIKPLQERVYAEIVGRVKPDDASVPYRDNGYWYYTRFESGSDYPLVARRKGNMDAPEEIMLDQPKMAAGKGYFAINAREVSPDNKRLAYAEDIVGRRQYVLRVKDLATGMLLSDTIPNVEPDIAWADDNRTLFYIEKDPVTLRGVRVKAHVLGTPLSADRLVHEEKDETFSMGLGRTASDKQLCIVVESTVSSEQRCAPTADPRTFKVLAPRQRDFLYRADHIGDRWIIRTNWNAPNYRLMTVADTAATGSREAWRPLVPTSDSVFIENFKPFDGFIAVEERSGSNKRVRVLGDDGQSRFVAADEPAFSMALDVNAEHATDWVRYSYDSLVTPRTTYETNALTGERRVLKVQPVPGYDPSKYITERVWVTARDGVRVPVSVVRAKGTPKDGSAPMLQYAYGSYGFSTDPVFQPLLPSLLDRGFVYAIAHVRGGQEMGRGWYDDGHLMNKKNTFTDFVDVTRALVKDGYAAKGSVAALGGSAGGLLMGAIANMAPEDYKVIIAQVPFVDVVTTMLDASIPLTTFEWDEWGNPAEKPAYDYMLSYSPYDNLKAGRYPAMFVGTGLWDSQVQYYEPAKYVAKLRKLKTDDNTLVFRINMEAGHGGKSGRLRRYRDQAEYVAFMLNEMGIKE
jgi:oligopeptidase B